MGPKASHWPTTITNNNSLPEPGGSTGNHWQQHGGRNRSYHHSTAAHSKSRNPHCRCNIFKLFPTCHPVAHPDSRHRIMQHQFLLRASLQHFCNNHMQLRSTLIVSLVVSCQSAGTEYSKDTGILRRLIHFGNIRRATA